jgi:hypothetical protein
MATARVLRRCAGLAGRRLGPSAALAALFLLALAGQVSTAAAQDEDTLLTAPAGPYRGRVVDAQTGRPIPDAVVVILWQRLDDQIDGVRRLVAAQETFTDSSGEFVHEVQSVEAKLPPRTLAPRLLIFRPGYTPVPDRPQVRPPGVSAARFSVPDATATMTAVSDPEDRSEAFNTFVAMLSAAQLFPGTQLPDTTELLRFELQSLGVRPLPPVPPRGGR